MRIARVNEEGWDIRDRVILTVSDRHISFDAGSTHGDTDATHNAHILHLGLECDSHKILIYSIDALRPSPRQTSENEP